MGHKGGIRRVFPGGNTAQGFFSYYDHVIGDEARRVFILKGGPGAGKSTFMKRIAQDMLERGFDVEFHHCSADPSSVDAVVFPTVGIALFDGTAPHVIDPKFPGLVDEIVDLGQFCDEAALAPHKDDIVKLSAEGRRSFRRAYNYLAAAKDVSANWEAVNTQAMDRVFAHRRALQLVADVLSITSSLGKTMDHISPGRRRRLFASSITPDGLRHHLDTLVDGLPHVFVVRGRPGTGTSMVLDKVADAVTDRGLDVELFFCAFDPHKLEHAVITDIGVAVITSVPPHDYEPPGAVAIDLDEGLSLTKADVEHAETAQQLFWHLLDHAIACLQDAKRYHLEVEALYAPAMNFEGMEQLRRRVRDRIFSFAGHP